MDFVYSIKRLIDQLFPFYQIGTGLPSTEIRSPVVLPLLYKKNDDTAQKRHRTKKVHMLSHSFYFLC